MIQHRKPRKGSYKNMNSNIKIIIKKKKKRNQHVRSTPIALIEKWYGVVFHQMAGFCRKAVFRTRAIIYD